MTKTIAVNKASNAAVAKTLAPISELASGTKPINLK